MEGRIVDLSLVGISLETSEQISIGENLKFSLLLSPGVDCEFFGKVVHMIKNNEYGIKLTQIDNPTRNKLGKFVIEQLKEQNRIIRMFMETKRYEQIPKNDSK